MSIEFRARPSEIMKIGDGYTAYCFDEACMYIRGKLLDGQSLPPELSGIECNAGFIDSFGGMKGVKLNDKRRHGRGVSDT